MKKNYFPCVDSQRAKPIIWQLEAVELTAGAPSGWPEAPQCADCSKKVTQ